VGGLLASLPLVSVLAFIWLWRDTGDAERIAAQARNRRFGLSFLRFLVMHINQGLIKAPASEPPHTLARSSLRRLLDLLHKPAQCVQGCVDPALVC
jgi:hypothetical protein